MANATDFIGTVYDTLAKILNIDNVSQSVFMQMAWPGYSLSPADFKPADAPNGPYDGEIAKEAFSHLANIVPTMKKMQFENSGFEVDDLYEILILSAIPVGATPDTLATNPINKLFSDAQYEFMQSRRGSKSDPNAFYYPCTATPGNWYDESASQFWSAIEIKSTDVKPVASTPTSPFIKAGGQALVNKGVWKTKPDAINENVIKTNVQQTIESKDIALKKRVTPLPATTVINTKPLNANIAMASKTTASATVKPANTNLTLTPMFAANLSATRNAAIFTTKSTPVNSFANPTLKANIQNLALTQQMDIKTSSKLNLAQRFLVKSLVIQQLTTKPASPTTDGFSISFKFCRVNIDRSWCKLALLSNKNWYMFNTAAKEYSTGTADNNPGMFPLLPVAFIVIRDLKITANWSQEDKNNLNNSVSFGFFDIRSGTLNQNTLEVKGQQIIAWISKLMPPLPPNQA